MRRLGHLGENVLHPVGNGIAVPCGVTDCDTYTWAAPEEGYDDAAAEEPGPSKDGDKRCDAEKRGHRPASWLREGGSAPAPGGIVFLHFSGARSSPYGCGNGARDIGAVRNRRRSPAH